MKIICRKQFQTPGIAARRSLTVLKRPLSVSPQPLVSSRRGVMFHYYMVYLLLSGSVMACCGVCLHALLKADSHDLRQSAHLKTLLRMERQLRADARNATSLKVDAGELEFVIHDSADSSVHESPSAENISVLPRTVRWTARDHRVTREVLQKLQPEESESVEQPEALPSRTPIASSDRFVFIKGTNVQLLSRGGSGAAVRFSEGIPSMNIFLKDVEILLNPVNRSDSEMPNSAGGPS